MTKFSWYLKRLQVMKPAEIVWRINERIHLYYLFLLWKWNRSSKLSGIVNPANSVFCSSRTEVLPDLEWDFNLDANSESDLLDGRHDALGFFWKWEANASSWHIAPETGKSWPLKFFGFISYRQGNASGDARVVWEPSRLQQLVALALLVKKTTDKNRGQAISLFEDELISWDMENPPLTGIHYVSSMECALRIIAVCYAFDLLRPYLDNKEQVSQTVLNIVGSHAYLIQHRISLFSSAGNHTIAECAGLIYAGVLFPEFKEAKNWKQKGLDIFTKEINRQILTDGGGIEQAFWYLLFITDLTGLVVKLLEHTNEPSPEISAAFHRAKNFLSSFASLPGELPEIGDSDNGYALSPFLRLSFDSKDSQDDLIKTFPDAGYTLIDKQGPINTQIIFDHGSLGMAPSYGHGHADALSILVSLNKQGLFIDPGTYTYTGDQQYRTYFRSTKAHNTVTVDGLDQANQETPFLWSQPFNSTLIKKEEDSSGILRLLAKHDGYAHLGVEHWRGISYSPERYIFIWDYLAGEGIHDLELNWHIANKIVQNKGDFIVHMDGSDALLSVSGGDISTSKGETEPLLGWRSQKYGVKKPVTTLQIKQSGTLPMEFATSVQFNMNNIVNFSKENETAIFKGWM